MADVCATLAKMGVTLFVIFAYPVDTLNAANLIHHTNLTKDHLKYEISLTLRNMAKNLIDSHAIELINMAR